MALELLIVEDDPLLGEAAADYFGSKGWKVQTAREGGRAMELFMERNFQLVLLDVMLPGENGFTICRRIREISEVPIFFITARVMEEDELNGYARGADDYVTKPFSLPVLYAKAMAMIGRVRGNAPAVRLCRGDLTVEMGTRQVWVKERKAELPPLEYEMLLFFMENPNRVFSREQLLIRFWGYDFDGNERVVDNHIKKLRQAIRESCCKIRTVRKAGYKLEVGEG